MNKNKKMLQSKARRNYQNLSKEEKTKNASMLVIDTKGILQKMNLAKKEKTKNVNMLSI